MNKTFFWSGIGLFLIELLSIIGVLLVWEGYNLLNILAITLITIVFLSFNILAGYLIYRGTQ